MASDRFCRHLHSAQVDTCLLTKPGHGSEIRVSLLPVHRCETVYGAPLLKTRLFSVPQCITDYLHIALCRNLLTYLLTLAYSYDWYCCKSVQAISVKPTKVMKPRGTSLSEILRLTLNNSSSRGGEVENISYLVHTEKWQPVMHDASVKHQTHTHTHMSLTDQWLQQWFKQWVSE